MTEQEYRESIELKEFIPSDKKQIWRTDRSYSAYVSQVVLAQSPVGSKLNISYDDNQEEPIIVWPEGSTPLTWAEIKDRVEELKAEKQSLEYKEKRAAEYPSIADQFDLLYHEGYDGWKAAVQAVKDKYPKPE